MGRRPNPLMAEFFERGPKLGNSSNRYQQTCKRCGEIFDRGRYETMIPHLTRRCPHINYTERAKIIFRLHDIAVPDLHPYIDPNFEPEPENDNNGKAPAAKTDTEVQVQEEAEDPTGSLTPQHGARDFDGLNVLAEASRRVDRNVPAIVSGYEPANQVNADVPLDPQLGSEPLTAVPAMGFMGPAAPRCTPNYSYNSMPPFNHTAVADLNMTSMDDTCAEDLSSIAATASATLLNNATVDADVNMTTSATQVVLESPYDHGDTSQDAFVGTDFEFAALQSAEGSTLRNNVPAGQAPRPIAINPQQQVSATAVGVNPVLAGKQRVRGSFEPERRNEVRELRKLGACLRCRMLRKTCSQGTPCHTCSLVENPRVWKASCVRTKLPEQLPLYYLMPHLVYASQAVGELMNDDDSTVAYAVGTLEISQFLSGKVIFKAREIITRVQAHIDEGRVLLLDLEAENIEGKAEHYLQSISAVVVAREPSWIMQVSLEMAQNLKAQERNVVTVEKPDNLIAEIIELWVATTVITDTQWPIFYSQEHRGVTTAITPTTHAGSYDLLKYQYRGAIERRASVICRSALRHLEARLLVRKKGNNFETFLAVFILMNCVDRMCWLYRSWTAGGADSPFDAPTQQYLGDTEAFVESIQMLLHVRQSESNIMADPLTGDLKACNAQDILLSQWLQASGLSSKPDDFFGTKQLEVHDSRSLDGLFSARLLLI